MEGNMLFLDKYCDTLQYSTKGENLRLIYKRAWSGEYKMPITFDRSVCCDLNETISREWLVTNGLGGYAAGTVAGVLTRMQHGLLVSSPLETAAPQLLLAKIDEEVVFDQRTYYLGTNEYRDGALNPAGFVHLETFCLEEGFPVFTYHLGGIDGIVLEKRIWMPHGYNTTYIQYRVLRTAPNAVNEAVGADMLNRIPGRRENTGEQTLDVGRGLGYLSPGPGARMITPTAQQTLNLTLLPFSAYRPHHQSQYGNNDWHFKVHVHQRGEQEELALPKGVAGCTIHAWDGAHPYHIFAVGHPESQTTFIPTGVWYWSFLRRHDQAAGLPSTDDLYLPGVIRTKLWPGEDATFTIIVTAEEISSLRFSPIQLDLSYKRSAERQRNILRTERYFGEGGETSQQLRALPFATTTTSPAEAYAQGEEYLRLLVQAADRFLARRSLPYKNDQLSLLDDTENTPFVPSTYYSMQESIRETLIAFPGLTLTTNRYDEARRLLRTIARYFKQGLLPDRLPTPDSPLEEGDYGSVDTTLWFFYALEHYLRATHDYELLDELYQRLVGSINWCKQGTYNGIQVDGKDGLLQAQHTGKALTWMNVVINNLPITQRAGKPVEVNALWYHALSLMHEWSQQLFSMRRINHTTSTYQEQAAQCKESFQQRFWYADGGYLCDVIDGPGGDDTSFRPNQLLALSLRYPVLDEKHWHSVLELVTQHLLTPYGLRTLAPYESDYRGQLKGNQEEHLRALHQGSAWPWLLGPYIDAWLRVALEALASDHPGNSQQGTRPEASAVGARTYNRDQQQSRVQRIRQKGFDVLEPFRKHLTEEMLGMISGAFSGDAPHHWNPAWGAGNPIYRGTYAVASALSTGEILRVYARFVQVDAGQSARTFSTAIL
jgi:glycogen debranching enzyme